MNVAHILLIAVVVQLLAPPVAMAQTRFPTPGPVPWPKPSQEPFRDLFGGQRVTPPPTVAPFFQVQPLPRPNRPEPPRVVCGTTVVPVDPAFDAAIRRVPPDDVRLAKRTVPAPPCERRER